MGRPTAIIDADGVFPQGTPRRWRQAGLRDRAASRGRALSAALHGAAGRRSGLGGGMRRARTRRRSRRARASSPTARAASRRSTACRSASTAWPVSISSLAEVDFYRLLPPGGYTKGLAAALRTDVGEGDIPPEALRQGLLSLQAAPPRRRRRRGRRSRASPTSRKPSCRAANTTARS